MKTRTLPLAAVLALAACGDPLPEPTVEARLRNDLPAACTMEQIAACPVVDVKACPAGFEAVIDYSADCCGHFSCQPLCSSARQRACSMTPAPICPPRHKLWIGTAVEDCCPAYRCEPDGTECDPTRESCACDQTDVACTLALPDCGPNVMPIVVGHTAGCCPIYQCPCGPIAGDPTGVAVTDPATGIVAPNPRCGCTTPNCKAGEQVVCAGADRCGGPCECKPAHGTCKSDAECGADARCDVSACRLPPMPTGIAAPVPTCAPEKCGPKPDIASRMCADGTIAGVTDRCLVQADGSCGWEIRHCPNTTPPECYGICVPNIQRGCKASTDCPAGQTCEVMCGGWGCSAGATPTMTDPATGMMSGAAPVPPPTCACPPDDPSCMCDAAGNCRGQTCVGVCVQPPGPICDPARMVACPTLAVACPNGAQPIQTGVNPDTCCPIYQCPVCSRPANATDLVAPTSCPTPRCACAKQTGTDPMSCCPTYECRPVNADGTCA